MVRFTIQKELLYLFLEMENGTFPKGKLNQRKQSIKLHFEKLKKKLEFRDFRLQNPLEITYHIFKRNDRNYIKVTYWFQMYSEYDGELIPQEKEGITKVKWIPETKLQKVLDNSYANIKLLI